MGEVTPCSPKIDSQHGECQSHIPSLSEKDNNYAHVILFILFYLTERDTERGNTSKGSVRGRSRIPAEQGAQCGARSQDSGVMT